MPLTACGLSANSAKSLPLIIRPLLVLLSILISLNINERVELLSIFKPLFAIIKFPPSAPLSEPKL